ncbi:MULTISPECIES: MAPEG family protein [Ferrimonas]|uniref:MAPEG family protein n=1 Tax=Ferrimonas TaxID=44011 RepID=UPI00041EA4E2|nr:MULTISPECIES: MAPEG family protein [Ferrimonas]USD39036.1 MAPEG family protein [Ferrimonas sp. SCSIO 43195]
MSLMISGIYIAATAAIMMVLAYRVVAMRRACGIGVGCGDNRSLEIRIRSHANLLEYAPLMLLMLIAAESNGASGWLLHGCGLIWLVARILHPWGLTGGNGGYHLGRFWGTLLSWIVILILIVENLRLALF